jgi:hypothetical protein
MAIMNKEDVPRLRLMSFKTPTGWLVIVGTQHKEGVAMMGTVFMPDPNHEWDQHELEGAYVM